MFSFIRWVDQIARLGRLGTTIDQVEKAAEAAIERRRNAPNLGALPVEDVADAGQPIYADKIGYVQHVNVQALQSCAEAHEAILTVVALPGVFTAPGRPLLFLRTAAGAFQRTSTNRLSSRSL